MRDRPPLIDDAMLGQFLDRPLFRNLVLRLTWAATWPATIDVRR